MATNDILLIDGIIDESKDLENVYRKIKTVIKKNLLEYENMEKKLIQEDRRNKKLKETEKEERQKKGKYKKIEKTKD